MKEMNYSRAIKIAILMFLAGMSFVSVRFVNLSQAPCPPGVMCAQVMTRNPLPFIISGLIFLAYFSWFVFSFSSFSIGKQVLFSIILFAVLFFLFSGPLKGLWWNWVVYQGF